MRMRLVLWLLALLLAGGLAEQSKLCDKIRHTKIVREANDVSLTVLDRLHFINILSNLQIKENTVRLKKASGRQHLYTTSEPVQCDQLACSRPFIDRVVKTVQKIIQFNQSVIFGDTISSSSCHLRYNSWPLEKCKKILMSGFIETKPSTGEFWAAVSRLAPGQYGHITLDRAERSEYSLRMRTEELGDLKGSVCRCPNSAQNLLKLQKQNYQLSKHIIQEGIQFIQNLFRFEIISLEAEMQSVCLGSSQSASNKKIFLLLKPCLAVLDSDKAELLRKQNKLVCAMYRTLINPQLCDLVKSVSGSRQRRSFPGRLMASVFDLTSKDEMQNEFHNSQMLAADLNHLKRTLTHKDKNVAIFARNYKKITDEFIKASAAQYNSTRTTRDHEKNLFRLWSESVATQKIIHKSESQSSVRETLRDAWAALDRTIGIIHLETEHITIEQIKPGQLLLIKPQASFAQRTFVEMNCVPNEKLKIPDIVRFFIDNGEHTTISNKIHDSDLVNTCIGNVDSKVEGNCIALMTHAPADHVAIQSNDTTVTIFSGRDVRCNVNSREVALKRGFHYFPLKGLSMVVCGHQVKVLNTTALRNEDARLAADVESLHLEIMTPDQHNASVYVDKLIDKLQLDPSDQYKFNVRLENLENQTDILRDTVVTDPTSHYSWLFTILAALIFTAPVCCCIFCCECCKPIKKALACLICAHVDSCGHYGAVMTQRRKDRKWEKMAGSWLSGVQRLRVLKEKPEIEKIFVLCENYTKPDITPLLEEANIKAEPAVAMVCLLLLKFKEALAGIKEPIEVDRYKLVHKAVVLSIGHCSNGFVNKEIVTVDYILHGVSDIVITSTDVGSLMFPDNKNSIRTFMEAYHGFLKGQVPN